jgi:uncharacterized cupin superfamily protein
VQHISGQREIHRWEPAPIPAAWVREGQPVARARVLEHSTDGDALMCVWDCTAGRFDWTYSINETVWLLEGEVVLTHGNGKRSHLRAGSSFFFPIGSQFQWTVPVYVRKIAFLHTPMPRQLQRVRRVLGAVKRLLAGNRSMDRPSAQPLVSPRDWL